MSESTILLKLSLGVLPVTFFLLSLIYLDSYKLVRLRWVLLTISAGGLAALLSYGINVTLIEAANLDSRTLSRYLAPLVEELLKAALIVYLLVRGRIGFLVDAAIFGFAVGTGFALVENPYYLSTLPDSPLILWLIRGFGTAIMHAGTTGIFAMASKSAWERGAYGRATAFLPGILAAIVIHSIFNHFLLSPMLQTIGVLLILPPLVLYVYGRSEKRLEEWLGTGFDMDTELVDLMQSGGFSRSPVGLYFQSLKEHFPGEVVADMICYLKLHVELSIRTKGVLMLRESGLPVKKDPEIRDKLAELRYLDSSLGKTGKLAIEPFLHTTTQDLWQLQFLEDSVAGKRPA